MTLTDNLVDSCTSRRGRRIQIAVASIGGADVVAPHREGADIQYGFTSLIQGRCADRGGAIRKCNATGRSLRSSTHCSYNSRKSDGLPKNAWIGIRSKSCETGALVHSLRDGI